MPRRPTSHWGKRPAHRTPGGSQCTALARSARLLRTVSTSEQIWVSTVLHLPRVSRLWEQRVGEGRSGKAPCPPLAPLPHSLQGQGKECWGGQRTAGCVRHIHQREPTVGTRVSGPRAGGGGRGGVSSFLPGLCWAPAPPCILSQDETVTELGPQDTDSTSDHPPRPGASVKAQPWSPSSATSCLGAPS